MLSSEKGIHLQQREELTHLQWIKEKGDGCKWRQVLLHLIPCQAVGELGIQ